MSFRYRLNFFVLFLQLKFTEKQNYNYIIDGYIE
jgi:hypothetical protein